MTMTSNMHTLPDSITTPGDVSATILELQAYLHKLRDYTVRQTVTALHNEQLPSLSKPTEELLALLHAPADKPAAIRECITSLESIRKTVPVAHLTLTLLPEMETKTQIVKWFRQSIHPQALLTFTARGDIGGGFLLQVGAKRYDLTFRSQLLTHKDSLSRIFHTLQKDEAAA